MALLRGVKTVRGEQVCSTVIDLRGRAHLLDPESTDTTLCGMVLDGAGDRPNGRSCSTCHEGAKEANARLRRLLDTEGADCPLSGQYVPSIPEMIQALRPTEPMPVTYDPTMTISWPVKFEELAATGPMPIGRQPMRGGNT